MAQPLLTTPPCSIPGLTGGMQPGTANVTHGKPGQHELAKAHTPFTCSCVISDGHRQMQNKPAWYGTKPIC